MDPKTNSAFFYGILMHPQILKRVIGNEGVHLKTYSAILLDYTRHQIKHADYPAVIPYSKSKALFDRELSEEEKSVRGLLVIGLSESEVKLLDLFKGEQYTSDLVPVHPLSPPTTLSTYIYDHHSTLSLAAPHKRCSSNLSAPILAYTYIWCKSLTRLIPSLWNFDDFAKYDAWKRTGIHVHSDKGINSKGSPQKKLQSVLTGDDLIDPLYTQILDECVKDKQPTGVMKKRTEKDRESVAQAERKAEADEGHQTHYADDRATKQNQPEAAAASASEVEKPEKATKFEAEKKYEKEKTDVKRLAQILLKPESEERALEETRRRAETAVSEAKAVEDLFTLARTDCADDCIFLPNGDVPPTSSEGRSGTNASGSQPPAKACAARDRTELYIHCPVDHSSHIKDKQDKQRGRSVPQADGPGCCRCCITQ